MFTFRGQLETVMQIKRNKENLGNWRAEKKAYIYSISNSAFNFYLLKTRKTLGGLC